HDHILTSGSRDRNIYHRDVRSPDQWLTKLAGHKQEICGLKWNQEDNQLASGGNDNKLMVWDKLNISYDDFIRTTDQRHPSRGCPSRSTTSSPACERRWPRTRRRPCSSCATRATAASSRCWWAA
ncbi:MAG: hypothetical protein EOO74_01780, partial [Myxococcales bacterium]